MHYQQPFVVLEAGAEAGRRGARVGPRRARSRRGATWSTARPGSCSSRPAGRCPTRRHLPTGDELVDHYVEPLAESSRDSAARALSTRASTRLAARISTRCAPRGATQQPFEIRLASGETIEARAVIDASGTWRRPNPAGSGGIAAARRARTSRSHRLWHSRCRRHGARALCRQARSRRRQRPFGVQRDSRSADARRSRRRRRAFIWAMRRDNLESVWGGGASDALEARGELGQRAKRAVESGRIRVLTPFRIRSIAKQRRRAAGDRRDSG